MTESRKVITIISLLFVAAVFAGIWLLPLPISEAVPERCLRLWFSAGWMIALFVRYLGHNLGARRREPSILKHGWIIAAALLAVSFLAHSLAVLLAGAALWFLGSGFYSGLGVEARAKGIASLMLFCSLALLSEHLLQNVPSSVLRNDVASVPPLAPPDRGNALFRKNGFRGERPCRDCPKETIRIVTTGGSSTFGIPMYDRRATYSSRLETLLRTNRPYEQYEVLNGGIPGYGLTQIVDSLRKEISKAEPDVVTVCAWFNDASSIPGWYGFQKLSDREAYKLVETLRAIDTMPGTSRFLQSRLYGVFRFWLLRLQSSLWSHAPKTPSRTKRRPRLNPAEFRAALEEIVELSKEHHFIPIFVFEPVHRTPRLSPKVRGFRYYQAMLDVGKEFGVPVVDTLEEFGKRRDELLFFDFIHPNQAGHEIIAELLYDKIRELRDSHQLPLG